MKNSTAMRKVKESTGLPKTAGRRAGSPRMKVAPVETELNPGLRDRIIAELDGSSIAEDSRVAYLAELTGRAVQTARRWIASEKPGLPDLMSFALLCHKFNSDANWMLGLIKRRYPLPTSSVGSDPNSCGNTQNTPDWVERLQSQVEQMSDGYEIKSMIGDDMEPRIRNGASIWVDTATTEIQQNGIYLLEYQGRILVRQVEIRIGEGLLLTCANMRYKPTSLKDAAAAKKAGLKVLGRVRLSLAVENL
jgi:hypothetical protein